MRKIGLICAPLMIAAALCLPVRQTPQLIRLHVLANSDSAEDQALKLEVRDGVLCAAQELLCGCDDFEQAYSVLSESLNGIEEAARREARGYPVSAELTREMYPQRDYGSFTLPEGRYHSLKISIGEAEGQNWWCVVYPTLCAPKNDLQAVPCAEEVPLRSVIWDWIGERWDALVRRGGRIACI